MVDDKRNSERRPAEVRVSFRDPQETYTQEFAVNISEDGLFVKTFYPKAVGDVITLRFLLPVQSAALEIRSQVVWVNLQGSKGPTGMGVKFLDLDEAKKKAILQFVIESQVTQQGF